MAGERVGIASAVDVINQHVWDVFTGNRKPRHGKNNAAHED